jgi:hypothetical protein
VGYVFLYLGTLLSVGFRFFFITWGVVFIRMLGSFEALERFGFLIGTNPIPLALY